MKRCIPIVMFLTLMFFPLLINIGLLTTSGTSTDASTLTIFGKEATFTCEWSSADGRQAIFATESGSRRFVHLSNQRLRAESGKQYQLKTLTIFKFGTCVWLTEA